MFSNISFKVSGISWNLNIDLVDLTQKQYISLPGSDTSFAVKCRGQMSLDVINIFITSFVDRTREQMYVFGKWNKCTNFQNKIVLSCLNVKLTRNRNNMIKYLLIGNLNSYFNDIDYQHKLSWAEASELCQQFDGDLPSFMSRDEMNEVIALLLKSQRIPFLEAIFIGLRFNENMLSISVFIHFKS